MLLKLKSILDNIKNKAEEDLPENNKSKDN